MEDKIVWVTGARGFIGVHLCSALRAKNLRVLQFVNPSSDLILGRFEFDLTPQGLNEALRMCGEPDAVYHLAGGGTVGASFSDPVSDFSSTCVSLSFLLQAIKGLKCKVVCASSAAVYGNQSAVIHGMDPSLHPSPLSPYGRHKYMSEILCTEAGNADQLNIALCRLFSVYGEGLRKQLPFELCRKVVTADYGSEISLGGTGDEKRDWIYVDDVVSALFRAEAYASPEVPIFNVGSAKPTSVATMASLIVGASGRNDLDLIFDGGKRVGDPVDLFSSSSSLPPNFSPKIPIEIGIEKYVTWFKADLQVNGG